LNSVTVQANEPEANTQDNTAVKQTRINFLPIALADSYTTNQGTTLTVPAPGVLANDTDQDSNPLIAIKVTDPTHGVLTLNSNGSFTYIPTSGYSGSDTFTYTANDGLQDSNPATVTIQVTPTGVPILPSSFYGEIHFSESPPAPGTVIQAWVTGMSTPAATTTVQAGSPPYYTSLDVPGDDPSTSLIKEGGAENDLITFILNGRTVATATWHSGTNARLDFNSTAVHLLPGWNLVSFNLVPANTAIADVLFSLGNSYDLVYAWDASGSTMGNWLSYAPVPGYGQSLTQLNEKMGFWIHLTAEATLDVAGSLPVSPTQITLATNAGGWNLVGFPAAAGRDLPGAIPTQVSLMYAFHPAVTDPWLMFDPAAPAWVNDLSALTPGWGYWVKVTAPVTWSVPYP
jgi:VCBS repeat-containing protein